MCARSIYRIHENRLLVREILLGEWDPIHVEQIGAPEYEYDMYIEGICELLVDDRTSLEQLAAHLLKIQSERMLVSVSDVALKRCHNAAKSLMEIRSKFRHSRN